MKHVTYILSVLVLSWVLWSCQKEEAIPQTPFFQVEESYVETSYSEANITLRLSENGHAFSHEVFKCKVHCFDEEGTFVRDIDMNSRDQMLVGSLSGLQPGKTYSYKVQVYSFNDITFDQTFSFNTLSSTLPSVSTQSVEVLDQTSATISISLDDWGGDKMPEWGLCYSTQQNPTVESPTGKVVSTQENEDHITLYSLQENTTYYVRAFAQNGVGTSYGKELSFTTLEYDVPTVKIIEYGFVTNNGAIVYGEVLTDGGVEVTERGYCYSETNNPKIGNNKVVSPLAGTGQYACALTGLQPSTTYYVRAYAINSKGVGYSLQTLSFTTKK